MRISELISMLSTFCPDADVVIMTHNHCDDFQELPIDDVHDAFCTGGDGSMVSIEVDIGNRV
jgi:hypothetical protein